MGEDVWYVHHDGERSGPLTWVELAELAGRGGVDPADLVWQPDWDDWRLADTVEGLLPVPKSDTEPVASSEGAPSDEESAESLVELVQADESAGEDPAAGVMETDATAEIETPTYGFPIDGAPTEGVPEDEASGDAAGDAAAEPEDSTDASAPPGEADDGPTAAAPPPDDVPATRHGRVVVSPDKDRTVLQRSVDPVLGLVRRILSEEVLNRIDRSMATVGQIAYLVAAVLVTVLLLVVGIRNRDVSVIVFGLAMLPAALLLAYSAARFLAAIAERAESTPTVFGSTGFLDGLAACAVGLGVLSTMAGLSTTIAGAGAWSLLSGLCVTFVLFYTAGAALGASLEPAAETGNATSERQAVAVLGFASKLILLRLAPVAFAAAALAAAMTTAWLLLGELREPTQIGFLAAWIGWRVLAVALLPMAAWFVFQLVWVVIGVAGSLIGAGDEPADETDGRGAGRE
jgi:hypothetical protein